jgi:major membrane immunogen (membrane-anchored lipoprotein)
MKNNNIIITLCSIILLGACQKKDNSGFDSSKLNIKISKPTEAQVFKKGDTVFISATADYISELHGYALNISDTTSKTTYFDLDEHVHESTFAIDTFWVDTLSSGANLQLTFDVEADHDGNGSSKIIHFKSN